MDTPLRRIFAVVVAITALPVGALAGFCAWVLDQQAGVFPAMTVGVIAGAAVGLPFAALLTVLDAIARRVGKRPELDDGEHIVAESMAGYVRSGFILVGGRSVGGRLYLTNKRLVFQPRHLNPTSERIEVPLDEVASLSAKSMLGLFANGMLVTTNANGILRFSVKKNRLWIAAIERAREAARHRDPPSAPPAPPPES